VARDMSIDPHNLTLLLDEPLMLAGQAQDVLTVEHFAFDLSLAPQGKTVIKAYLRSAYAHWRPLKVERRRYVEEKEGLAETVIDLLSPRFPGLRQQVEMVDVATPLTNERYTGSWLVAQAWPPQRGVLPVLLHGLSKTLPGLEGFHMVGQWAGAAGGLPNVAAMARRLVQDICGQDRRPFVTSFAA
jgi:phytoene dehydrogenase-like protein